jgi:hypothetical protein
MQFDRYEESHERRRLSGQLQPRGTQTGVSSLGMFLFGLPFFGFGIWATLAGLKLVPLDESKLQAPHWVLVAFGIVFALAGLMVWGMGWRQFKANKRRAEEGLRNPVLADYPWDERGFTPPRWSRAAKAIGGVIFFALFLSMFNWWAFVQGGPWMLKAIVILFDALLAFFAWQTAMLIGRTLKFGPSRIEFTHFPYQPGEKISLHWTVPSGLTHVAAGTLTLRCVEEWYETRGSGKNRSKQLVQEAVWSATGHLEHPRTLTPGQPEELRFEIPASALGTRMNAKDTKPVFWELLIELKMAGLDFREPYLVPIYRNEGGGFGLSPIRLQD